jgi:uncharacterized protein
MVDDISGSPPPGTGRERVVLAAAAALQGLALAVLVLPGGGAGWAIARSAAAAGAGALVVTAVVAGSRRFATTAALAWGTLGLVVGAGVGVMHVLRAGATLRAVTGLVVLATGLTLLAVATTGAVRAVGGWRRWLAIPVALVVVQFLVLPLTLAVYAVNVPRGAIAETTPADRGLAYEDVTLTTSDGVALAAWYVPPSGTPSRDAAVVLLHGAGPSSNRTSVLDEAVVLAANGYGVLLLDVRGHGRSEGNAMDWGWHGNDDIAPAVDYLASRADVAAVAAVGMSMGGEEALTAAAADPRIRAVVAEGATRRAEADGDGLRPGPPTGWIEQVVDWIAFGTADLLSGAEPPVALRAAVAAVAPRPVLLIAAGQVPEEAEAAALMEAAAPGAVTVWEVAGSGHTGGLDTAPAEWEERVVGFLDAAITPPP